MSTKLSGIITATGAATDRLSGVPGYSSGVSILDYNSGNLSLSSVSGPNIMYDGNQTYTYSMVFSSPGSHFSYISDNPSNFTWDSGINVRINSITNNGSDADYETKTTFTSDSSVVVTCSFNDQSGNSVTKYKTVTLTKLVVTSTLAADKYIYNINEDPPGDEYITLSLTGSRNDGAGSFTYYVDYGDGFSYTSSVQTGPIAISHYFPLWTENTYTVTLKSVDNFSKSGSAVIYIDGVA